MVTRTLQAGGSALVLRLLLLLLLLGQEAWCQTRTKVAVTPDPTAPALATTTPTFVSPSLSEHEGELSESAKTGISVGVTLGSILLVGSITIWCMIRRRNRALSRPQRRAPPPGETDEENAGIPPAEDGYGKAKEEGYEMSPTTRTPDGFIIQNAAGYPTAPDPVYSASQQHHHQYPQYAQTNAYTNIHSAEMSNAYAQGANAYPGIQISDYSQQGYVQQGGYDILQTYQPEGQQITQPQHQQPQAQPQQQYQQQASQGEQISWIYPVSVASSSYPVSAASTTGSNSMQHDSQQQQQNKYLQQQDHQARHYQQNSPSPDPEHTLNQNHIYDQQQQQVYQSVNNNQNQSQQRHQSYDQGLDLNNTDLSAFMSYPGEHNYFGGNSDNSSYTNGPMHTSEYHVPPPHPNVSELPDQRKPVEMMGDGHFHEAP